MDRRDSGVKRLKFRDTALLLGVAAVCLMVPSIAGASTLGSTNGQIDYDAVAGEINELTVKRVGANYEFTDTGIVAMTATAPCVNVLAAFATCPAEGVFQFDVSLLDMGDSFSYDASVAGNGLAVRVNSGSGDDTLTAAGPTPASFFTEDGVDRVTGSDAGDDIRTGNDGDIVSSGAGNDSLNPGPGADVFSAGPGNDGIDDTDTADPGDVLDGGPGLGDSLDSRDRENAIFISVDGTANDGEATENDNVTAIERIDSGDGADVLTGAAGPNQLYGNAGNDVLNGGAGPDYMFGSDGADTLNGGDDRDEVVGGNGGDQLSGGAGDDEFRGEFFDDGADIYGGGPGIDSIFEVGDFQARGVTIDLDGIADDGPTTPIPLVPADNAGSDIENLTADIPGEGSELDFSAAPDILTGNGAANEIKGGGGNDRISGLGGADALAGGPGDDNLDGGTGIDSLDGAGGADRVRSRDGSPDEVDCGSATDTLLADSLDVFAITCDNSSTGAQLRTSGAKLRKGKARLKVTCPAAEGITCKVSLSAAKGKKVVAKGSGKVKQGKTSAITVKLTKAGKKARSKKLILKAKTIFKDASGARVTTARKLVLKR